jgi:N-acetylglucosaminyldiphosphoundecaprenol N-acetyl-beta-D-mannosaminyltransferase
MISKRRIISLDISIIGYRECIEVITNLAQRRASSYVCVANVHMCIEAYGDVDFQDCVNSADLVVADGVPVAKGVNLLYGVEQSRIAGMDLLPDLMAEAQNKALSVFFYGSTQDVIDSTWAFCNSHYPQLIVAGSISPPFRKLSAEESADVIAKINSSGCNIVFVALGCPKQEVWMSQMKGKINATMVGIGGALPVLIGDQKRAPLWMQKFALEWFYRLMQEPKRLFKRYFVTNSKFIWLFGRQFIREKILKLN